MARRWSTPSRAAGRSFWERERPFTLVVLDPRAPGAPRDAARTELERVAAERGLPISLIPTGRWWMPTASRCGAMRCCRRRSATAAMRFSSAAGTRGADGAAAVDLVHARASSSWSGPLAAAIDHTVDLLVPQQASIAGQTEAEARVADRRRELARPYANVERLLQSVPGVRRANVAAADAEQRHLRGHRARRRCRALSRRSAAGAPGARRAARRAPRVPLPASGLNALQPRRSPCATCPTSSA